MELDNELDSDEVEDVRFAEYVDAVADNVDMFYRQGLNSTALQSLVDGATGKSEVDEYIEEMVDRDILELEFEDKKKASGIYTITEEAKEDLEVDSSEVVQHSGETYWIGRDESQVIVYGPNHRTERNYMSSEIAENAFFSAATGNIDSLLE